MLPPDSLDKEMSCGVFSNPNGEITIVYDKDVRSVIQWVEYDVTDNQLYLVHEDGLPQSMGIEISAESGEHLKIAQEVILAKVSGKKNEYQNRVSLVIKDY